MFSIFIYTFIISFNPTVGRLHSAVQPDLSYQASMGYSVSSGKPFDGSSNQTYRIDLPTIEFDLQYSPADAWAIQLKIPDFVHFTNLDLYYSTDSNWGLGAELGLLSSVYGVFTFPTDNSFFTFTPRAHLFALGSDWDNGFNNGVSNLWLDFQGALGLKTKTKTTLAAYGGYTFIPGDGFSWFNYSGYFQPVKTRIKHLASAGFSIRF